MNLRHVNNTPSTFCPICASSPKPLFRALILTKYGVQYYLCPKCRCVFTENPYWLEEAYSSAIASTDVGLIARNLNIANKLTCLAYFLLGKNSSYIDVAGGYGLLCRIMRDRGFHYYWQDKYCENIFAQGFEADSVGKKFTTASFFELLEHTPKPLEFCQEIIKQYNVDTLLFTTELYKGSPPGPDDWWYYGRETGQHITFFSINTLHYMARSLNMSLYSHGGIHMLTKRRINNFLFRLSCKKIFADILSLYIQRRMPSFIQKDYEKARRQAL